MVQFLLKLLLKQRFLAVYHDFHQLILTAKFQSLYVKESGSEILEKSELEILEKLESNILPPTPQPWHLPSCILTYSSKRRDLTRK